MVTLVTELDIERLTPRSTRILNVGIGQATKGFRSLRVPE
jgi:hypothetical protein